MDINFSNIVYGVVLVASCSLVAGLSTIFCLWLADKVIK